MADQKTKLSNLREIDFTALDYDTIQEELLQYIQVASAERGIVDDFLAGDASRVIIDLFSYIGDILAFRIDTLANEMYLSTANRRQSIINLLELVAQRPLNPTHATLTVNLVMQDIAQAEIPIPARFALSTTGLDGSSVTFEIMNSPTDYYSPVIIPAGVTNWNVRAFSGNFTTYDIISPGTYGYEIVLPEYPVIEDSIRVSVLPVAIEDLSPSLIESTRITEVTSLVEATDDIIYRVKYNEDGKAILTFATENFGKIPPLGQTIHVDYRTGGGVNSNVGVGAIQTTASLVSTGGEIINTIISNPDTIAEGGYNLEDLEDVKLRVPSLVRANDNLVSAQDYEAIVGRIAGVQAVFAVDAYADRAYYDGRFEVPDNFCYLWVLPESGGEVSPDLRQIIAYELESGRLTAIENRVLNPVYQNWTLSATVQVDEFADALAVRENITGALINEFGRYNAAFKNQVRISKINAVIQGVTGVEYCNITSPTSDLVADYNTVLRLLENNIVLNITQS